MTIIFINNNYIALRENQFVEVTAEKEKMWGIYDIAESC